MTDNENPADVQVNKLFREEEQVGLEIVWEGNGWDPESAWIKAFNDSLVTLSHYE